MERKTEEERGKERGKKEFEQKGEEREGKEELKRSIEVKKKHVRVKKNKE